MQHSSLFMIPPLPPSLGSGSCTHIQPLRVFWQTLLDVSCIWMQNQISPYPEKGRNFFSMELCNAYASFQILDGDFGEQSTIHYESYFMIVEAVIEITEGFYIFYWPLEYIHCNMYPWFDRKRHYYCYLFLMLMIRFLALLCEIQILRVWDADVMS